MEIDRGAAALTPSGRYYVEYNISNASTIHRLLHIAVLETVLVSTDGQALYYYNIVIPIVSREVVFALHDFACRGLTYCNPLYDSSTIV